MMFGKKNELFLFDKEHYAPAVKSSIYTGKKTHAS